MARTISDIHTEMIEAKNNDPQLSGLTSNSVTAIWRLLFYIVAVAIWTLEKLFDKYRFDVDETISNLRPHTLRWYRNKALRFRAGQELMFESDQYDDTGLTPEQIAEMEVVKQAAAVELDDNIFKRYVRIKIAGGIDDLKRLDQDIITAVEAYFGQIKDAGVLVRVTSHDADLLFGGLIIHYNPTVLDSAGRVVGGTGNSEPVRDAINNYLQNLTFNGQFSIMRMIDAVQQVRGVENAHNLDLWAINSINERTNILNVFIPDAGYMRISPGTNDFVIKYVPNI